MSTANVNEEQKEDGGPTNLNEEQKQDGGPSPASEQQKHLSDAQNAFNFLAFSMGYYNFLPAQPDILKLPKDIKLPFDVANLIYRFSAFFTMLHITRKWVQEQVPPEDKLTKKYRREKMKMFEELYDRLEELDEARQQLESQERFPSLYDPLLFFKQPKENAWFISFDKLLYPIMGWILIKLPDVIANNQDLPSDEEMANALQDAILIYQKEVAMQKEQFPPMQNEHSSLIRQYKQMVKIAEELVEQGEELI